MFIVVPLFLIIPLGTIEAARILAVFPNPAISHQIVFQTFYQELVNRGHELVVITAYPNRQNESPANLTVIDIKELAIELFKNKFTFKEFLGSKRKIISYSEKAREVYKSTFKEFILHQKIQEVIHNKHLSFDLIILESFFTAALLLSSIFKAPTIFISSFTSGGNYELMGVPIHHLYHPAIYSHKINNNDFWDAINDFYIDFRVSNIVSNSEIDNEIIKSIVYNADDMKTLYYNYVTVLFVNINPIWEGNRPVPASIVHLGGLHHQTQRELLSKDLKSYLDSSKNGVIYMSFGTNVSPSQLPKEKIDIMMKVLSEMPYDVLLKWDTDKLIRKAKNIRVAKWFPQSDLLKHPKVKLFITQAGLQSTDEAIIAGVPMIAIPMLFDQWCNAEKYVDHKIGIKIELETLSEDEFKNAIENIIGDERYRRNIVRLRDLMYDRPQRPLERAVWWTEHVLRHGGARHLRAPATNMSWIERLEFELIIIVITVLLFVMVILFFIFHCIFMFTTNFIIFRSVLSFNILKLRL